MDFLHEFEDIEKIGKGVLATVQRELHPHHGIRFKWMIRNNLDTIVKMDGKDKLIFCNVLHRNLVHRDLPGGNILQDDFKNAYIADLGLSITVNIALKLKPDEIL
ncbi:hypothetical protein C2G38_2168511 [Gigaspora rosea]|uniref:Protein kinase domain-containing protein n=1 Tax=Gigaspora rosea TaxID=44941 RepID=A0A397VRB7_9GLOM|nr:hypothetical protein C2G38_2168511 [Gigaspora rosea]